jgi:DNA-binding MarR family transcriptional regulator
LDPLPEPYPYVVFLPAEQKDKVLGAIFGSKSSFEILRYFLKHGVANKIYQKDLIRELAYSNKTIIGNLKTLTELGILTESMEKVESEGRTVWVKTYKLTNVGKWFALLLAEEKELSNEEKAEILQSVFRSYIRWVKNLSEKLNMNKGILKKIFDEEMKE